MKQHEALTRFSSPKLVYIKAHRAKDLAQEMGAMQNADSDDADNPLERDPNAIWYVVHAADGSRIAILDDRDTAFAAARANELYPVSVH